MRVLPDGWATAQIGDIAQVIRGVSYRGADARSEPAEGLKPLLRATNIGSKLDFENLVYIPQQYVSEQQYLRVGDIVIAASSGSLSVVGKAAPLTNSWLGSFGAFCFCLRPSSADLGAYLSHFLRGDEYRHRISSLAAGVNINNLRAAHLQGLEISLPPLTEQHRIVAELEKQLTRLDAAVAGLRRAQANLKHYRASVLQAAVEGALLDANAVRRKIAEDDHLPAGWKWATVGELAAPERNSLTDGPFGSNLKTAHYTSHGPRVVRLQNIGDGQFLDAEAHISEGHFSSLSKHQVFAGDVVIAALGDNPPRACVIPSTLGPAIVKADCVRFKADPTRALNKYVCYALNAKPTRASMAKIVHGVGRPRLNLTDIRSITLPLPPLDEQERIVAEIEQHLSVVGALEAAVQNALKRAERLRQSVLKRAFEGRLVAQDSEDEPASVLLERIRAERSSAIGSATTRRSRRAPATQLSLPR